MQDLQDSFVPLVVATGAFLAVLVWRVRPEVPWSRTRRASRVALRQATERIDAAPDDAERARALCDAADLVAKHVNGLASAKALYIRALRTDPASVEVVQRAVAGMARRPRTLESLLWRHLAAMSWNESRDATRATLEALRALYDGRLKNAVRARALANARDALLP
jgi:hypothetical protein